MTNRVASAIQRRRSALSWLRALPIRVLLLVGLCAVVLLLAADRLLIPPWLRWVTAGQLTAVRLKTFAGDWPGLFPLAALAAIVLIANPVYARLRPLGWLVPTAATAAAVLLVIDVPRALNHASAVPLDYWARLPVAAFLAIILAKLLLLHRHATRGHTGIGDEPPSLLPSQEKDLDELRSLITDRQLGRVLPLEGRQGEGKSFLVQRLKYDWDREPSEPAVVVVDVWQQQSEADLQAAILEALYLHPAYLARLGWLQVPVSFLFVRWIAAMRGLRSTLELHWSKNQANLELDLDIPGLRWQSHFERATARMARGHRSTVVVLDEIDRATPLVTQAALTLARRSVDVPGVTVLIPYIRSLIRYKAFNPLQPVLNDLGSSMDAILYEERFIVRSDRALGGDPADSILQTWQDLRTQVVAHKAGFLPKAPAGDAPTQALRLGVFANANGPFRDRLQERFEEKYLGAAVLALRPPEPADLASMVTGFPSLRRKVDKLLVEPKPQEWDAEVRRVTEEGLKRWQKGRSELVGPPLRVLEGALYRILQEAVTAAHDQRLLRPQDVATLAVVAYDTAGLVHGSPGSSL